MRPASALPALLLAACGLSEATGNDPREGAAPSVAYLRWTPGPGDTCTIEVHNQYSTVGPDGKRYPTWHPPVDPSGCSFGHEHGRDPRGSDLYAGVGDIPLGYANEQLDIWDPSGKRHEDHVGHKIEWENDVLMHFDGVPDDVLNLRCDVLVKLHQGTHSKDAFTNNLHEVVYHLKCTDGSEAHITQMLAIGRPGEFTRTCDGARIQAGTAIPANSPDGGGQRVIPDRVCVNQHILVPAGQNSSFGSGLHESWQTHIQVKTDEGHGLASFDPYFQVDFPSRFHDPALTDLTGKAIALCYEVEANGDRARSSLCNTATGNGTITDLVQTDPRSPFNGVRRFVDLNGIRLNNPDGPEVWYTDPFGRRARTQAFPGSIRQFISRTNNSAVPFHGPRIGGDRNYGAATVHAPN